MYADVLCTTGYLNCHLAAIFPLLWLVLTDRPPYYRLCPPDDCGLPVYTVYSVYSPEHPNLASVNDPPTPHSPQQREIRESKRERHTSIKIQCARQKIQASLWLHIGAVNHYRTLNKHTEMVTDSAGVISDKATLSHNA